MNMINQTFSVAYAAMVLGGFAAPADDFAPFIIYNKSDKSYSLITNTISYLPSGTTGNVTIYFN